MPTNRQLKANRVNSQASTGPRTARGKARASQNARSHGLNIPVLLDPVLLAKIGNLAREIGGEGASPEILLIARSIAEAQIELDRVRQFRRAYLSCNFGEFDESDALAERAKVGESLSSLTKRLVALDRYERRALSRRKFAIRALDSARRQTAGEPGQDGS
jgi:hypothetical protein